MGVPDDYKISDGCFSCNHVFTAPHCQDTEFYCMVLESHRPISGLLPSELFGVYIINNLHLKYNSKEYKDMYQKMRQAWLKFAEENAVSYNGICSQYKK